MSRFAATFKSQLLTALAVAVATQLVNAVLKKVLNRQPKETAS